MRILVLGLAAGMALAPLAALAADSTPVTEPAPTIATSNQIICHYYYSHGTVIKNPDCHPLRFWAWRRHDLQQGIREFQLRALVQKG